MLALCGALLATAWTAAATAEPAQPVPAVEARVTYVSGATVYLDAGTEAGLYEGAIVEVLRGDEVLARLTVTYVTARRASASPVGPDPLPPVAVGDTVRFTPRSAEIPPPAAAGPPVHSERRAASLRGAGVHGRIGLRWLGVRDDVQDFSQPALDLRVTGTAIGGTPFDFDADLRPRRTYRSRTDGTSEDTSSNRIYSLMGAWRPGPFRLAVGRQMSPALGPLVLLDGLSGEYRARRVAAGFFAGTEPAPDDLSFDSDTRDYGIYVEGTSAPGATTRFWVNGGAVSSRTDGEINRDFVYATGRLVRGGFQGFALQEVDVNRGWRKEAEGSSFTRSGSFVSLRQRFARSWSVQGGWDSRRNVRIYRDVVTPETEFDDAYREGIFGGLEWRSRRWLAGADHRSTSGGEAGSAHATTLRFGTMGWTSAGIDARARLTDYSGPYVEGLLVAASTGIGLLDGRLHVDAHGGVRDEQETTELADSYTVQWIGSEVELIAGRRLLFTLSYDRTSGGGEDNDQVYLTSSWRF
jgi:hypothetical protein